jgi:hypothetical protein
MSTTTTRRNLLRFGTTAAAYAAGASIVTGGIALASQAKGAAPAGVSPGLRQAFAALADAERVSTEYHETIYEPTRLRWLAAQDAVPHTIIAPLTVWRGSPTFWGTDNPHAIKFAKEMVGDNPRTSKKGDVIRARKLIAADHRRTRTIARVRGATDIDRRGDESNRLYGLMVDAEDAVCAYPAASLADLEAKLAFFAERDLAQNDGNIELVLADARRLLAQEAR